MSEFRKRLHISFSKLQAAVISKRKVSTVEISTVEISAVKIAYVQISTIKISTLTIFRNWVNNINFKRLKLRFSYDMITSIEKSFILLRYRLLAV
jgi:hypothetical protein